jgi:hypothetical protein
MLGTTTQGYLPIAVLWRFLFLTVISMLLIGCAQPGYVVRPQPQPSSVPATTRIYYYPANNQSAARQDRDRYECHLWAVRRSGFDPGRTPLAPHQQVKVIPAPAPGTHTALGAAGGAMIGAVLAGPRETGQGLAIGAITGAMLGGASEAAQQQQAREIQQSYDTKSARDYAYAEKQARNYRRAIAACLDGRGYTVR